MKCNLSFSLCLSTASIITSPCLRASDTCSKQIIHFRLPRNLLPQLRCNRPRGRRCLLHGCDRDRSSGVVSRMRRGFPDIPLRDLRGAIKSLSQPIAMLVRTYIYITERVRFPCSVHVSRRSRSKNLEHPVKRKFLPRFPPFDPYAPFHTCGLYWVCLMCHLGTRSSNLSCE